MHNLAACRAKTETQGVADDTAREIWEQQNKMEHEDFLFFVSDKLQALCVVATKNHVKHQHEAEQLEAH